MGNPGISNHEAKLYFILNHEIHPDVIKHKKNQIKNLESLLHYTPKLYPAIIDQAIEDFAIGSELQKLLIKIAIKYPLDLDDITYLSKLKGQDRYRSDPNPKLYLFCLGRRGGKTTMVTQIARILSTVERADYFSGTVKQLDVIRDLKCDNFHGSTLKSDNFRRCRNTILIDEFFTCEKLFHDSLQISNSGHIIVFLSYYDKKIIIPDNIPSCVISMSTPDLTPTIGSQMIHNMSVHHTQEYYPPSIDNLITHKWMS
jgi:hypothetical protein